MQTIKHRSMVLQFSDNASYQQVLDLLNTSVENGVRTSTKYDNHSTVSLTIAGVHGASLLKKVRRHFEGLVRTREEWGERQYIPLQVVMDVTAISRRTAGRRLRRAPPHKKLYRNCDNNGVIRRYAAVKEEDILYMFDDQTIRAAQDIIERCKNHPLIRRNLGGHLPDISVGQGNK